MNRNPENIVRVSFSSSLSFPFSSYVQCTGRIMIVAITFLAKLMSVAMMLNGAGSMDNTHLVPMAIYPYYS